MFCSKCTRLLAEYGRLTQIYRIAVAALSDGVEFAPAAEYLPLKATADQTWIDAEVARVELKQHKRIHSKAN
jgi:hypothetical protein